MKMQRVKRFVLMAAAAAATVSCGDVVRQGRAPVFVVIDQLLASRGASTPGPYTGTLISDVITNVTTGGNCSTAKPCATVFNDYGRATLRMVPKDIGPQATATVPSPSPNNEVTITRYRVEYRRADGRNTQGVDVPWSFDGAATGTIPSGGVLALDFEIVRHNAKQEPPLVALQENNPIIATIAYVTFYGRDRVGNEVNVTGQILIEFGNFGDPS